MIAEIPEIFFSLEQKRFRHIRAIFDSYSLPYRQHSDPDYRAHILLKYEHIERVCQEMSGISRYFNMSEEEQAFTQSIALLHDIGRFEQFDTYGTYADAQSENHAAMAIRIIKETGLADEFDEIQFHLLERAILNHNLPVLDQHEDVQCRFYSGMMRDSDKLDIWRVTLQYNIFHTIKSEDFPSTYKVPEKLLTCFREQRIIPLTQVDSFYDSILFRLSWVYDLNFPYTLQEFNQREICPKLLAKLPPSSELENITMLVNDYIRQSLK